MARKKIVFVIVEGPSDSDALGLYFNRFFDRNSVYVHIVHGDLTTMKGKIKDNIANIVRSYANSTHLQKSDFQEIIHIVDLDGVYISDDDVIGDSVAVEPIYSTTEIRTCNPEGIKFRNELKRKNLDVISSIQTVWGGVTYYAFYMSCNLEHVLYNKLNCSDLEKECYAHNFAKKFSRDLPAFVTFIAKSSFSVPGTYIETWKFIKQKRHSLERYTNLGICLDSSGVINSDLKSNDTRDMNMSQSDNGNS